MRKIYPCIVGLGYVGLPIFLRLQKRFKTVGFDNNKKRLKNLNKKYDSNLVYQKTQLKLKKKSKFTSQLKDLLKCNFFIVAVPTPIYKNKLPNLSHLMEAANTLSKILKKDDIIFFESTVYPGVTKYLSQKILEKKTDLKINRDFWLGYSPERINPGDSQKTVEKIKKIVAFEKLPIVIKNKIIKVYKNLTKKIVLSDSIEHTEMSKVIENIQRDINIAFVNEILIICDRLNLSFSKVIRLAKTKWNFLNFSPGLVGGHCLPVDPYYLYYIAKKKDVNAQFMLSGRNVNNSMQRFVEKKIFERIRDIKNIKNNKKKILIIGITYKPSVSDLRNSIPFSIFKKMKRIKNLIVKAHDPYVDRDTTKKFNIIKYLDFNKEKFDLIILLVNHRIVIKSLKKVLNVKNLKILDIFHYLK